MNQYALEMLGLYPLRHYDVIITSYELWRNGNRVLIQINP